MPATRTIPFLFILPPFIAPIAHHIVLKHPWSTGSQNHGLDEAIVVRELIEAGFRNVALYDFTKADGEDYFLIFEQK
jgi:hypothetical protein